MTRPKNVPKTIIHLMWIENCQDNHAIIWSVNFYFRTNIHYLYDCALQLIMEAKASMKIELLGIKIQFIIKINSIKI